MELNLVLFFQCMPKQFVILEVLPDVIILGHTYRKKSETVRQAILLANIGQWLVVLMSSSIKFYRHYLLPKSSFLFFLVWSVNGGRITVYCVLLALWPAHVAYICRSHWLASAYYLLALYRLRHNENILQITVSYNNNNINNRKL